MKVATQTPNPVAQLQTLQKTQTSLHAEIESLLAHHASLNCGPTTSPLIDSQGFPRNDVDVYTARHIRSQLVRKQNDYKQVMKEIEEVLPLVFQSLRDGGGASVAAGMVGADVPGTGTQIAFAVVNSVAAHSPAEEAGLVAGDRIIVFGDVKLEIGGNAAAALGRVASCVVDGVDLEVVVARGDQMAILKLTPKQWEGRGLLGCHLLPAN